MHPEIEHLINMSFIDGSITEKEKSVILKKAQTLGIDIDEIEVILEAKIHEHNERKSKVKKDAIHKCPSCGDIVNGLSKVCSSCGFILDDLSLQGGVTSSLNNSINELENLIISVKSAPKPSFLDRMKVVILTYFTFGIYLIFRKFISKQSDSFDSLIAKCEKESRSIKVNYGEDKKIRLLLEELNNEIQNVIKERNNKAKKANLGCGGLILIFVLIYIVFVFMAFDKSSDMFNNKESKKIDSLISIGEIESAKMEINNIKSEYSREDALDKILIYEIDQYIKSSEIDSARNLTSSIKSPFTRKDIEDKLLLIEINKLLDQNNIITAKRKAIQINDENERSAILNKIKLLE